MAAARRMDGLLVLMVLIWGVNYSVLKRTFSEIPPQPFNALRLILASAVFYGAIRIARNQARSRGRTVSRAYYTTHDLTRRDRFTLLGLGLVGHCFYQLCFVGGVAATSVSNAALIIGASPVVIATVSAALGRERISRFHWMGAAISITGIYFVVGHGATFGGATFKGDALTMASVACWAVYTLGASGLMARHSPLYVTGMTMAIGAVPYVLIALPQMLQIDWLAIPGWVWLALVFSTLFALNLAYLIWYMAVQQIGPARTSIFSNLVPVTAMTVAALWLGEPIGAAKMIGAAAVLTGVFLTRLGRPAQAIPIEE